MGVSVSLCINMASISANGVDLLPSPSVGSESVLWQNDWLDLDALWDGEWGRSRDGCIRWERASKGNGQFWR